MKTSLLRVLITLLMAALVAAPVAHAQRSLGKKKGPASKLYMAEAVGESTVQNGDKIYTARQATAFDAPGTVIETKAGAHNAIVYSNGTGMFVDENTRVEIDRFVQEPFQPERNTNLGAIIEPSISQSTVHVAQGAVGVCTSQLISGSSMTYSTPHGSVNIRGGRVSIETTGNTTHIDLLEGDITVRGGGRDVGGHILRPGERATIVPSLTGGQPTISVGPIPPAVLQTVSERTDTACQAKKTVTFEVIEKKAEEGLEATAEEPAGADGEGTAANDTGTTPGTESAEDEAAGAESEQEIVARPTVPAEPPTNIVASPSALPGTTQ
jgi:hypothetical protein